MVTIVATNSTGIGIRYNLLTTNNLLVPQTVSVISTDSTAVTGTGSNQTVEVRGYLEGRGFDGIQLGDAGSDTGNRVINSGLIRGADDGVQMTGSQNIISNSGIIVATYGVFLTSTTGAGESNISNSGSIGGRLYGILQGGTENLSIENSGFIFGSSSAISSGSGRLTLENTGRIVGNILMGDGDDIYDGRGGTVIGQIRGENNNDRFVLGLAVEDIDGGANFDVLDFRLGGAVAMSLDGSVAGTGAAAGDSYAGIESVLGSNGNDTLVGDAGANVLRGYGGADLLNGRLGNDRIGGGTGVDTMTGGLGNDIFEFRALAECGDRITDYANSVGNNDTFNILASAFGGGLAAGALNAAQFRVRADNVAQDGDDRFIFRTTDQTLWFDQNGNAAGGLTLVADLQAGIVLSAGDIVLI
jgi:Ca2+-binding RTX toxin-like protein